MKTALSRSLAVLLVLCLWMAVVPVAVRAADGDVCEIVDTATGYTSLDDALAAVESGQTIRLLTNIDYNGCIVVQDKNIVFDLNGFVLNVVNSNTEPGEMKDVCGLFVKGNAAVDLVDLPGTGEFNVSSHFYGVLVECDFDSGEEARVTVTNATGSYGVASSHSKITVKGNVTCSEPGGYGVLASYENAWVIVEGDVISDKDGSTGVRADFKALVEVRGSITVDGEGTTGISAFDAAGVDVEGDVTVSGVDSIGIYAALGSYVEVAGNVSGGYGGVEGWKSAEINIIGNVSSSDASGYGIKVTDDCIVDVTNGDVRSGGVGVWIWGEGGEGVSEVLVAGIIEAPEYILIGSQTFTPEDGYLDPEPIDGYHYLIYSDDPLTLGRVFVRSTGSGPADEFAGGDGSEESPYLIATPEHLDSVRNYLGPEHADKHFRLTADLDLDVAPYNSGAGWEPIGTVGTPFTGSFDGDGHTISGLFIDRSDTNCVGLFGSTDAGAEITGLNLADVMVIGRENVGGLVGSNDGTIQACSVTGTVTGRKHVGGLVGANYGDIVRSCATAGVESVTYAGGLVGWNDGSIWESFATGTVTGTEDDIEYTYVGGLVGRNGGSISDSYARGDVHGQENIGGLVGYNRGSITTCYSTGEIDADSWAGGLVGFNHSDGSVTDSYWDTGTSGFTESDGGIGKATGDMKLQSTYENWDFESTWDISDGHNDGYPFLRWHDAPEPPPETYSLTIVAGTGGTITSGSSGDYEAGTVINIAATPSAGYNFSRWTSVGGGAFGSATSAATTFTMPANDVTITAEFTPTPSGGSSGGGDSSPSRPTYNAEVLEGGTLWSTLPVSFNRNSRSASVNLGTQSGEIFAGERSTIVVPSIPGADAYILEAPASSLSDPDGTGSVTFATAHGSITIPEDMLSGMQGAEGKTARISIAQGDKSALPADVQASIGDRPLVQLTLHLDGKQVEWNNPEAPVTVSIPYEPTAEELRNPHGIVIWYLDGAGNPICVPNGRYDAETGTVTFQTTHFSLYAVGYKDVRFDDVPDDAWYAAAVNFIAARDITTGAGDGRYLPEATLTRGDFMVLVMRAYGIVPDENPADNFSDAGDTYYTGYLGAAKRLGLSRGVGDNMYAPDREITRQEMFTLLYNVLKVVGRLPEGDCGKTLLDFTDGYLVADWAVEAMTLLVRTGTINGSDGALTPLNTTTRAEMAQVLFNLLVK